MTILWETGIPQQIYAKFYCKWKRVKREVRLLANVFKKYGAKKLIEFGCGLGRHGYLLSKMGFDILLTDVKDWRFGVARKLPFLKLDVINDDSINEKFDGAYAINFLIIFKYEDLITVLKKIGNMIDNGVFIADYNFTLYDEPDEMVISANGRTYRAVLEGDSIKPIDKGILYEYRVKVVDDQGRILGVEEASYPVYSKEVIFNAIKEAGFEVAEIIWAKWNQNNYVYEFTEKDEKEADSAFIVLRKAIY